MKLQTKMIVAFTMIVLVMGSFQFIYFQQRIGSEFQQFLDNQQIGVANRLQAFFESYYQSNHSFDKVDAVLNVDQQMMGMGKRHVGMQMAGIPQLYNLELVIADNSGIVISDSQDEYRGQQVGSIIGIHRELVVDGQKVGELVVIRSRDIMLQNLAAQFMQSTNTTILLGTVIGSIIAVLVGVFLAKEMTQPLTKLLEAIKRLSLGESSVRVDISKKDEFFELANAFNQMSEQLSQNETLRKKLMADVAHELRTPLAVIRGKLESIQEGAIEANDKEIMLLVDDVYRLTRLVNDLQQLSLAEAGKLPLHKQWINVYHFLKKIVLNIGLLAEEKKISIDLESSQKNIMLSFDEDRMTQVIVNLIDNALRHTPENGKISIKLLETLDTKEVLILVSDTGEGIEADLLPFVFDRFSRTDDSRSRDAGGTGLGLSIVKGFIEAHHGTITVSSETGKGTTFAIRLPKQESITEK